MTASLEIMKTEAKRFKMVNFFPVTASFLALTTGWICFSTTLDSVLNYRGLDKSSFASAQFQFFNSEKNSAYASAAKPRFVLISFFCFSVLKEVI